MTNRTELEQLARDVVCETLHGPVPMETVAKLAYGVIELSARVRELEDKPDTSPPMWADHDIERIANDVGDEFVCKRCGMRWEILEELGTPYTPGPCYGPNKFTKETGK